MSLPNVTPTTGKITRMPTISGVPHGNTGQVRILAALGKLVLLVNGGCSNVTLVY